MKCIWHCCENIIPEFSRKSKFCSKKCKNKYYVDRRRKKIKQLAIEYKGGKCYKCGYNKCLDALDFHHTDRKEKDFSISTNGYTRSWNKVKNELDKCILVCSNCHREIHFELGGNNK